MKAARRPDQPRPFEAGKHVNVSPRLALPKQEAAASLGMSEDSFDRYVRANVPCVRRGRLRLYRPADLDHWLKVNASLALEDAA